MPAFLGLLFAAGLASASPAPAATPLWQAADAEALLAKIQDIGADGLDPLDYDPDALRAALRATDAALLNRTAGQAFIRLAGDLANGHVTPSARIGWHIAKPAMTDTDARSLMWSAVSQHRVAETLASLLPQTADYLQLKAALAHTPQTDAAALASLRANLERWRWMPRALGRRYLLVNVPAFEATLVEDGKVVERHRIIVGKTSMPTPQFAAQIQAVLVNPWWDIPANIAAEGISRAMRINPAGARARGYVLSHGHYRQRPGPGNALGQLKLVMPNPFTVYLHDTPTKELFGQDVRAFSHGCIRTENMLGLASSLLASTSGWSEGAILNAIQAGRTIQVPLANPVPVYVGYFTATADDHGQVARFADVYRRDGPVIAQLTDRQRPTRLAFQWPVRAETQEKSK